MKNKLDILSDDTETKKSILELINQIGSEDPNLWLDSFYELSKRKHGIIDDSEEEDNSFQDEDFEEDILKQI